MPASGRPTIEPLKGIAVEMPAGRQPTWGRALKESAGCFHIQAHPEFGPLKILGPGRAKENPLIFEASVTVRHALDPEIQGDEYYVPRS